MDLTSEDVARWPSETRVLMDAAIERCGAKAVKVWSSKALMRSIRKKHAPVRPFSVEHEREGRSWVASSDMAREVDFDDVEDFDFKQADVPRAIPTPPPWNYGAWFATLEASRMDVAYTNLVNTVQAQILNHFRIDSPPANGDSVTINGVTFRVD